MIPLLLILSAVASSALLFWQEIGVANSSIRQAEVDDLNIALTQLQNMLNTQLAADSLEDAKLSLSVSASHHGIRTLLLADENNRVMLANRYLWEGSPAPQVSGYVEAIARQVRQTQASSVSSNASLLSGYYPVTLRIAVGGMGRDRVGVIFVEYDLAPQLAQARHNAVVQASLFGGLMIAVAIAVAFLLHCLVSRRLKKLVEVSQRFAAGDMDARVHLRGHDELAEFGHAFDDMASQRKEAQDEVVQLSMRNRLILDSMGEGIYGLDTEGRCTFVNPAASQLFGFRVEELLGQHCHTLFHHTKPDGSPYPVEECPVQAVCTRGVAHRGSDLYWRKDGSSFPVEFISTPILELGQIAGAVVAFRDITERKRVESLLSQREYEYRSLAENSPDVIVRYDREGRRIYVNPEFERVNHLTAQQVYGKTPAELSTELKPRADVFTEKLLAAMASGLATKVDLSWVKDGRPVCWFVRVVPEFDAGGKVTSALTIWSDISERKLIEEQLRRSEHGLAEAQRMAQLGNWELDLASNVLTWSDQIYRIFEIDPENFGASYDAFRNAIHPDDREMVNEAYTESVNRKIPYDIVHRLLMKDGRVKYVNEKCETYYGEDGKPLRSVGTVHDITEQKIADIALSALKDDLEHRVRVRTTELEAANKELEAFSYSVSHDLRTPLRAIDGFSRILLDDYTDKLDDEGKRLLHVVRDNTNRMGQLIDDILKFSRVGRLELGCAEIDMERQAREVFEELRPDAADDKLQLQMEAVPPARGDAAMMRQVWVNLLSNAIKFSRPREAARIKVGSLKQGDETVYFVKDNGVGFDMQYADKLFGVFQRLHAVTEFEGTGIGLAIVKRIVTRHGGRVWAEGKVDEGATIYFALPTKEKEHG